jgi:predicted DNA-binding protein (UPF0251 family)
MYFDIRNITQEEIMRVLRLSKRFLNSIMLMSESKLIAKFLLHGKVAA